MLGTATITGIFYGTDGAAVTDADVYIVPKHKYVASIDGAAWVPRAVTGRTDATGAIGTLDGATFTPGIVLGQGQHEISVRKGGASHNGVLTIDAAMVSSGTEIPLDVALQPAPAPEIVSAVQSAAGDAQSARDKSEKWAENPEDVEVEPGKFSALHHAAKSGAFASAASAFASDAEDAQAGAEAVAPSLAAQIGTLASVIGQIEAELAANSGDAGEAALTFAYALSQITGQVAAQINGGQAALRGGTLDDPALRIGSAGIYSSATDTLSVAIAGVEVARFTASGLTIFGTVTEA